MAKAREITKRRKAVRNIYKITRVMQMVATARFQRALKRAKGTRPYLDKLSAIVQDTLLGAQGSAELHRHPLLISRTPCRRTAILVVTSNRGLAGAFNGNILRLAMGHIRELEESGKQVEIYVGSPSRLNTRPRVSIPTGTQTGEPVSITGMPRTRPSVLPSATARTRPPPRCCCTSPVR